MRFKKIIALTSLITLLLLTPALWLLIRHPKSTEAAWFDDNWLYRQKVEITNSSTAQTDFQAMITVNTSTLITAGKMQTDCDDIRVTDINGKVLPYWLEPNTCNTASTKIWTKVPSIPTTNATIYLYYGNPSATSDSSTANTFIREITGVQGAWNMDESSWNNNCSADTVLDASGNSNHGKACPATTGPDGGDTGKFGNGGDFDGSNDYVEIADQSYFSPANNSLTVSIWFKFPTSGDCGYPITKWGAYGGGLIEWAMTLLDYEGNTYLRTNIYNNTDSGYLGTNPDTLLSANTWYHLAFVFDKSADSLTLYLDSVQKAQDTTSTGSLVDSSTPVVIGKPYTGEPVFNFNGSIDQVRIYNQALTAAEISDLYGTGGDRQGYVTTNYPNKELVRKYSSSVSVGSPASEEKAPGPVAFWKFDEGVDNTCSGGTNDACDSTDNANDGAKTGATWQTEDMCISGKCLLFDGTDDYVTRADDPDFDWAASDTFTIQGWARHGPQSSGQDIVLAKYESTDADGGYKLLMEADGDITFGIDDDNSSFPEDSVTSTAATYDDNQWHHLTAIKNGTTSISLYIDGQLIATDAAISASNTLVNDDALYIGIDGDGSSNAWKGFIDEVKIYPYVRSAAQIKTDYQRGSASHGSSAVLGAKDLIFLSDGLVGYWKMDESSWTNDCSTDTVLDSSGNANHGDACPATTGPDGGDSGKFGNGGDFDGSNDYVSLPTIELSNRSFTISGWINPDTSPPSSQIWFSAHSAAGIQRSIHLRIYDTGVVRFGFWGTGYDLDTSAGVINFDEWSHIVYSYDYGSDTSRIFINGSENVSGNQGPFVGSSPSLGIGRWENGPSEYFKGSIDDVRIYNRALSPAEVQDLYQWAPGPVAHWKMDEKVSGDSQTIYDSSTYGNNGTTNDGANNTGMNCTVPGKYGGGCEFDGVDDYVNAGNGVNLNIANAITIGAWVKFDSLVSNQEIISKSTQGHGVEVLLFNNNLSFYVMGSSEKYINYSTSNLNTTKWFYIVASHEGQGGKPMRLYVDGVRVDNGTVNTPTTIDDPTSLRFGAWGTATPRFFDGIIDDVRIYNYARTQKQIIEDMNAGHPAVGSPVGSAVGYWKFDEGYGDTANDSSPQDNDGDLGGSGQTCPASGTVPCPSWENSGKFGKALDFDGTDDRIIVPDDNSLDVTTDMTITAWVDIDTLQLQGIVAKDKGAISDTPYLLRTTAAGKASCSIFDSSTYENATGTTTLSGGIWYFLTCTYDGANLKIYVNGIVETTEPATITPSQTTGDLYIGDNPAGAGREFDGTIDEVKIYNFALTADEIKQEYNRGATVLMGATGTDASGNPSWSSERAYCPPGDTTASCGPIAEWKMDEMVTGDSQTLYDTSENNNTGTTYYGANASGMNCTKPGKYGGGCDFDGTDDYVSVGTSGMSASAGTVFAWIYVTDTPTGNEFIYSHRQTADTNDRIYLFNDDGVFSIGLGTSSAIASTYTIELNKWVHLGMTWSGANYQIYVNGVADNSGSASQPSGIHTIAWIGSYRAISEYFDGTIDNVKIYNYALSQAQIAWEYNRGGPVGWWRFDECQGGTANDASGQGNNGTITIGASGTQDGLGTCTDGDTTNAWYNGRNGKWNYALSFDGTDDYVNCGSDSSIDDFIKTDNTISLWVKTTIWPAWTTLGIISKTTDTGSTGFYMSLEVRESPSVAQLFFRWENQNQKIWSGALVNPLNDGNWHHIVLNGVQSGNNTINYLYVDGVAHADTISIPATLIISDASDSLKIGRAYKDGIRYWGGLIDDVQIFNFALTSQQIKTLYNEGSAVRFGPETGAP